jgi:hypothetical protein
MTVDHKANARYLRKVADSAWLIFDSLPEGRDKNAAYKTASKLSYRAWKAGQRDKR